jgi:hypothetical protein
LRPRRSSGSARRGATPHCPAIRINRAPVGAGRRWWIAVSAIALLDIQYLQNHAQAWWLSGRYHGFMCEMPFLSASQPARLVGALSNDRGSCIILIATPFVPPARKAGRKRTRAGHRPELDELTGTTHPFGMNISPIYPERFLGDCRTFTGTCRAGDHIRPVQAGSNRQTPMLRKFSFPDLKDSFFLYVACQTPFNAC